MHSKCHCGYEICCDESKYKLLQRLHHKKCKFPPVRINYLDAQDVILDERTGRVVKDERTEKTKKTFTLSV
jgi:hypothetical protein